MIKGKVREAKQPLTKELILSKVDDYNIMRFYLGQDFDFKKKFSSPLRSKDDTPNLCFFPGDEGIILFKDFANGKGGDCFKFVQELYNLNFHQALVKIDQDMGLGIMSTPTHKFKVQLVKKPDSIHKQTKLIQIEPRPLTREELDYWWDYQITEKELYDNDVYGIQKLWINKQLVPNYNKQLRFAYLYDSYLKIYTPMSKEFKWISSCPNDFISGFDNIKFKIKFGRQDKRLIISKSKKDQIVLSKFFKDVCSTQNESSSAINEENMGYILRGYLPEDIFILYDNDEAGIKAASYYSEYGFSTLFTPDIFRREGIKDWADLVKHKGLDTMENYLKIKKLI